MRALWLVVAVASSGCLHATRVAVSAPRGEPTLTVATYNVNFGLAGDRAVLDAVAATGAQVVLLQETTPDWERTARRALGALYPHQRWMHAPAAGGIAVLSKGPLISADVLDNPHGWFKALRVVTQTPLGKLQALAVHLHPPVTEDGDWVAGYLSTGPLRERELSGFTASLEPRLPTVVAGDFNEGTSGPAVRSLEARGLRTVLPELAPAATTWRWQVGPLRLRAQLDHIAYSPALEPLDARVLRVGESDHFPVVATFVRAKPGTLRPPPPHGTSLTVSASAR